MGKLLRLEEERKMRQKPEELDLTRQLKNVVLLSKDCDEDIDIDFLSKEDIEEWLKKRIAKELLDRHMIGVEQFLCGMYISKMLSEFGHNLPEKWYVTDFMNDYLETNEPKVLKNGGDFCLLLCSVFPERINKGLLSVSDYVDFGSNLYYQFYTVSGIPVAYYLSNNFLQMQDVIKSAINR